MTEWLWFEPDDVIAIHHQQISMHGGSPGLRDIGLLESALAHPMTKAQYGERDIAVLAAAYGYGLARDHPFVDGNKRTALVVMETFLVVYGHEVKADNAETVAVILALAAGDVSEDDLTLWLRDNLIPFETP